MVEWLAGNRIIGTTAERPNFGVPSGSVAGWKELKRKKLGVDGNSLEVTGLDNKQYYMVLVYVNRSAGSQARIRFNDDTSAGTGTNYADRLETNGSNTPNAASNCMIASGADGSPMFTTGYIANLSGKEKLMISHSATREGTGTGNKPFVYGFVGKWTGTDAISSINFYPSTNNFLADSEIVVLGYDPDDNHTDNFWEELADVPLSSSGDTISSGVFTAKKYLWVQAWAKVSPATGAPAFRVGNTTVSVDTEYATRASSNGNAYDQAASTSIDMAPAFIQNNETCFVNIFIINNASEEKILVWNSTLSGGSGAGAETKERRGASKWTDTTDQINIVSLINAGSGDFSDGTIKVWGHD